VRPWVERRKDDSGIQLKRTSDMDAWRRLRLSRKRREVPAEWHDDERHQSPRPEDRLWRNRRRKRRKKSRKFDDDADNRVTQSRMRTKKSDDGEEVGFHRERWWRRKKFGDEKGEWWRKRTFDDERVDESETGVGND